MIIEILKTDHILYISLIIIVTGKNTNAFLEWNKFLFTNYRHKYIEKFVHTLSFTWQLCFNNNFNFVVQTVKNKAHAGQFIKMASFHGSLSILKYALKYIHNICYNNNYVIRWASKKGNLKIVKFAISKGAFIENGFIYRWPLPVENKIIIKYLTIFDNYFS